MDKKTNIAGVKHETVYGVAWIDKKDMPRDLVELGNMIEQQYNETGEKTGVVAQPLFYDDGMQLRYRTISWDQWVEVAKAFMGEDQIKRLKKLNEDNEQWTTDKI